MDAITGNRYVKKIMMLLAFGMAAGVHAKPNILLLCIDDLRPELASFGADYIHSPNIDGLAASGRAFHRHYVNAPSCGPSRCTLLTGRYGAVDNRALFRRATAMQDDPASVHPAMPEWFRRHGYTTVSVGKVSHHPGGRGGRDWNDNARIEMPGAWDRHLMPVGGWQHPRGAMHGLARGEIRVEAGAMDVFQSAEGDDSIYPDGLIVEEGLEQLRQLASDDKPFFLAVGLIRPHLPFGAPAKYMEHYEGVELPPVPYPEKPIWKTTWHGSGEFMKYNRWGKDPNRNGEFAQEVRRHYAACVSYADAQVGKILDELDKLKLEERTIVILWGDHGWHLGEHSIWGKHTLFEESLRAPLIIKYPDMPRAGEKTDAVISTVDIFPTLCELSKVPAPAFSQGRSLVPILENPAAKGWGAYAYHADQKTFRTERWRMILHSDGYIELYDHASDVKETLNVRENYPEVVKELLGECAKYL
jgi:iduronate 2-sulfatase